MAGEQNVARLVERDLLFRIPEGVKVDPSVSLGADDAALTQDGRRQCVATRKAGGRCTAAAVRGHLLCAVHEGRAEPAAGGRARAAKLRQQREAAEERSVLSRLGTRAVIAQALLERHEQVAAAVQLLADDAADENAPHAQRLKSAQALIPWIDQALGRPTERVEHRIPGSLEEVQAMDSAQLEVLVAEGRKRRLRALPQPLED